MGVDIRKAIGLLFLIVGIQLAAYGLFSDPALYRKTMGVNVNLLWGSVLLVFGAVFLAAGRRGGRAKGAANDE